MYVFVHRITLTSLEVDEGYSRQPEVLAFLKYQVGAKSLVMFLFFARIPKANMDQCNLNDSLPLV